MSKRKPLASKKDEWVKENYQGKTEQQIQDSNAIAMFALICLGLTLITTIIHEVYLWVQK